MIKLLVDGKDVEVEEGSTVMQACEDSGAEIPRFCYHEKLSIAGNCRMCLVEMEKSPKPIASCAMPATNGMVVYTNTEKVKKAREGVMEFLLINHPLDCPVCDQGGECDLQDQSLYFGNSKSRFSENKRSVKDKNFGPLIKTVMTRCIHCTRCVRFMDEMAGVHQIGALNRGEDMEISSLLHNGISNELSGNIIDLCPVGALTSKPYAFSARSWELEHTESIDVLDAVGSNIRVDHFGGVVKRILPIRNDSINQEWLADKARFSYDGLLQQRLDRPYIRKNGKLVPVSWEEALKVAGKKLKSANNKNFASVSGPYVDIETLVSAKDLFKKLNLNNIDCRYDSSKVPSKYRSDWILNTGIEGLDNIDSLLLIGCDLKREAPVLCSRIRQRWLTGELSIMGLGVTNDLPFKLKDIGSDLRQLLNASENSLISKFFSKSDYPLVLIGNACLTREDGETLHGIAKGIAERVNAIRDDWLGFGVLQTSASRVGAMDVGFVPNNKGKDTAAILKALNKNEIEILYLIECDELNLNNTGDAFIIYQGHHGDKGAAKADVVFPTSAYTEKDSLFVNIEGRPQFTRKAVQSPGLSKDGWKVFRALSDTLKLSLDYNSHEQLLNRIFLEWQHLSKIGEKSKGKWFNNNLKEHIFANDYLDSSQLSDYYLSCSLTRASKTMAECSLAFSKKNINKR